jgi:hypothetical protein
MLIVRSRSRSSRIPPATPDGQHDGTDTVDEGQCRSIGRSIAVLGGEIISPAGSTIDRGPHRKINGEQTNETPSCRRRFDDEAPFCGEAQGCQEGSFAAAQHA